MGGKNDDSETTLKEEDVHGMGENRAKIFFNELWCETRDAIFKLDSMEEMEISLNLVEWETIRGHEIVSIVGHFFLHHLLVVLFDLNHFMGASVWVCVCIGSESIRRRRIHVSKSICISSSKHFWSWCVNRWCESYLNRSYFCSFYVCLLGWQLSNK